MRANFLSRKTHRWIALLVGIQAMFWMVSGAYMATIDIDFIHGDPLVKNINEPLPEDLSGLYPISAVLQRYPKSKAVNVVSRLGDPHHVVQTVSEEILYKKSGRKIDYWYGGRGRKDLFYVEEFDELEEQHANFRWQPVLSEAGSGDDWHGPTGYVHIAAREDLLKHLDTPAECEYYICGPPPMLSATRQMLADLGIPEDQVFFDDFGI